MIFAFLPEQQQQQQQCGCKSATTNTASTVLNLLGSCRRGALQTGLLSMAWRSNVRNRRTCGCVGLDWRLRNEEEPKKESRGDGSRRTKQQQSGFLPLYTLRCMPVAAASSSFGFAAHSARLPANCAFAGLAVRSWVAALRHPTKPRKRQAYPSEVGNVRSAPTSAAGTHAKLIHKWDPLPLASTSRMS